MITCNDDDNDTENKGSPNLHSLLHHDGTDQKNIRYLGSIPYFFVKFHKQVFSSANKISSLYTLKIGLV